MAPRASAGDPAVTVGSVWRDNDPRRRKSRRCRVLGIDAMERRVLVRWIGIRSGEHAESFVKLSRFNGRSNGYGPVQSARRKRRRK